MDIVVEGLERRGSMWGKSARPRRGREEEGEGEWQRAEKEVLK